MIVKPIFSAVQAGWRGAVVAFALTETASAAQLGGADPIDLPLVRIGAAFVVCALAALAAALVVKQVGGRAFVSWNAGRGLSNLRQSARLTVFETRRLSIHADICRFGYADKEYLAIVSPGGATIVRELDVAIEDSPVSTIEAAP